MQASRFPLSPSKFPLSASRIRWLASTFRSQAPRFPRQASRERAFGRFRVGSRLLCRALSAFPRLPGEAWRLRMALAKLLASPATGWGRLGSGFLRRDLSGSRGFRTMHGDCGWRWPNSWRVRLRGGGAWGQAFCAGTFRVPEASGGGVELGGELANLWARSATDEPDPRFGRFALVGPAASAFSQR